MEENDTNLGCYGGESSLVKTEQKYSLKQLEILELPVTMSVLFVIESGIRTLSVD